MKRYTKSKRLISASTGLDVMKAFTIFHYTKGMACKKPPQDISFNQSNNSKSIVNFSSHRALFQRKHPPQPHYTTPVSVPQMCPCVCGSCERQTQHSALLEQHWTGRRPVDTVRGNLLVCVHESKTAWNWNKKLRAHNPCYTGCCMHSQIMREREKKKIPQSTTNTYMNGCKYRPDICVHN